MEKIVEAALKLIVALVLGSLALCLVAQLVFAALQALIPWFGWALIVAAAVSGIVVGVSAFQAPRRTPIRGPGDPLGGFKVRRPNG